MSFPPFVLVSDKKTNGPYNCSDTSEAEAIGLCHNLFSNADIRWTIGDARTAKRIAPRARDWLSDSKCAHPADRSENNGLVSFM
jgi:hypothetical protein